MSDIVSKTDNFLKAIEKYAQEQRSKLESEAEDFKARELNKAEEEGLREAYVLIQRKMAAINTQISSERSKAENASRKKIFIKRKEIEDRVFDRAKEKLIEYTSGETYQARLLKSVQAISKTLTADDVVLSVKQSDLVLKDKIVSAFGRACEVVVSKEIEIGGIIGVSRKMGLLADETLDTGLLQQREWFCENSGLKVTD